MTDSLNPQNDHQLPNKLFRWAAVVAWMAVIFIFSTNPNSNQETANVFGSFNFSVRKLAHMTEYGILFALFRHALEDSLSWKEGLRPLVLTVLYACTDEFHQAFVPGRSASFVDVGIDTIGGACGWLGLICWQKLTKKRK